MFMSRLLGGTPTMFSPYSRTSPDVGSSKPAIIRSVVVLPQPDGPSSEKNSPLSIARSTRSTAWTWPSSALNCLVTPTSSMAGADDPEVSMA